MSANFPDSPFIGQVYVVDRKKYVWDGNAWRSTAFSSGSNFQPVPPQVGQNNGDVWIDSNTRKIEVFDSNTNVWEKTYPNIKVNAGPPIAFLSPVQYPIEGDIYYDTNDLELKVYDGSTWNSVAQGLNGFNQTSNVLNGSTNATIDVFSSNNVAGVKWILTAEDFINQKSCTIEILANNKLNTEINYTASKVGDSMNFTFDVQILNGNSIRLLVTNNENHSVTFSTNRYETIRS